MHCNSEGNLYNDPEHASQMDVDVLPTIEPPLRYK